MFAAVRTFRGAVARSFHTGKVSISRWKFPDPWLLATGKQLFEAIEHKKGNTDPFLIKPVVRGPGTRECPNVILSPYDKRLVGCICNEDAMHIVYFWLHECYPRRCDCNYWFVLERFELPTYKTMCKCS